MRLHRTDRDRLPRPSPGRAVVLASLAVAVLLAAGPAAGERFTPVPEASPPLVPVGAPPKDYLLLSSRPVVFRLVGPGELAGFARVHFAAAEGAAKPGRIVLFGVPGLPAANNLTFRPSRRDGYGDARAGRPSSGRRVAWSIPAGEHLLEIRGDCPDGADIFLTFYYDGPVQPHVAPVAITAPQKPAPRKKSPYTLLGEVGLDFIYDTNFLNNSDDYLAEWEAGLYPEKFRMNTKDDFVISPSLDLEVRRKFLAMGQTRLRANFSRWEYASNPIKNNEEWDFYLRQYVGRGKSLELYYFYAPEQYIRELSDREPYTPPEDPSIYQGFLFTKNVFGAAYRQGIVKRLSGKLILENNRRYYNRPFLENDINAWEVRGVLYWRPHRRWNFSFDYSYENAQARAADQVGETPETSDDSDASYLRDLYRLGITWKPAFLKKAVDQIDLSGLLMLYWYPTDKELFEDPFHVGRKDTQYVITLEVRRKLSRNLVAKLGTRFTGRTVDSPWPGDITLDKDFTKQRYWLRLAYSL